MAGRPMGYAARFGAILVLLLTAAGAASTSLAAQPDGRAIYDISYAPRAARPDRRQTLDIYLPARSPRPPPLLVFIHGGFWVESDDQWGIGRGIASDLTPHGVAVALVRYRLAPAHMHPAQIEDVAAGLAYLVRNAQKHGYDPSRIIVAGHSAGGHLAALLALRPEYLGRHGINSAALHSIVAISGIYTLELSGRWSSPQRVAIQRTFSADPSTLADASPLTHARADIPRFIIAAAERDLNGFQDQARRFAKALNDAGAKEVDTVIVPRYDHFSIVRLGARGNPLKDLILDASGIRPLPQDMAEVMAAKRAWAKPPYSTEPFWRYADLIETRPVDSGFMRSLAFFYRAMRHELSGHPLEHYHAIDLFRLLERLGRDGDYVVLKNIRNEVQVWHRDEIKPYKPLVVVGLDDEKNLFNLQLFYQMLREYSWREGAAPPYMALPLGAFIYFENAAPPALRPQLWHYSLTIEGIGARTEDPYAKLRALPADLFKALTESNGCVSCHTVRGIGSRSHHVTAVEPRPHGGFALPLETYPPEVFETFLFRQEEAAARIGATPNNVEGPARASLLKLVSDGRSVQSDP